MLRLTKKTEYALLALRALATRSEQPVSTKVIAEQYRIPEMLLAKVLQKMTRAGLLEGTKGSRGGYQLAKELDTVPLMEVLTIFDKKIALVECQQADGGSCLQHAYCDLRGPLAALNRAVMAPLRTMTVQDLFTGPYVPVDAKAGKGVGAHRILSR